MGSKGKSSVRILTKKFTLKKATELGFKGQIKFGQGGREFLAKVAKKCNLGNSDRDQLTGSHGTGFGEMNVRQRA